LLTGCATGWQANPTRDYAIVIEGLSADQSATVMQVADEWVAATGGFIHFHGATFTAPLDAATITITGLPTDSIQRQDGEGVLGYQLATGENSQVQLPNDTFDTVFAETTRHELGHTLGLKHTAAGTIMCADLQCAAPTITCADVQQLCTIWNCYAPSLPACAN